MNEDTVVYELTIEDIQNVAEEELGKKLNSSQLRIIQEKIGDYIPWWECILNVIQCELTSKKKK